MQARRSALQKLDRSDFTHAGLWLDKFLLAQTEGDKKDEQATVAKAKLIQDVCRIKVPIGYPESFARRRVLFASLETSGLALSREATTQGRMIIGLGQKGPIEAGLALEHTWGVPIIPGSALKGLTVAAAHLLLDDKSWRKRPGGEKAPSLALLAGTLQCIGSVVFHDAWWIPEGDTLPIHPDVMTVHHPEYYADGTLPPSDMDSPNPVAFASVTGRFLVVVEKTSSKIDNQFLDAALCILKLGLTHLGVGAKTNAGYGRMLLDYESPLERQQKEESAAAAKAEQQRKAQAEAQRKAQDEQDAAQLLAQQRLELATRDAQTKMKQLAINNAANLVPAILASLGDGELCRTLARQMIEKLNRKTVQAKASENKEWAKNLLLSAGLGE